MRAVTFGGSRILMTSVIVPPLVQDVLNLVCVKIGLEERKAIIPEGDGEYFDSVISLNRPTLLYM